MLNLYYRKAKIFHPDVNQAKGNILGLIMHKYTKMWVIKNTPILL
jgi:hypothetical protein